MRLKYMGPKPVITHHGVSFKDGKEDKYVYLMTTLEILKALEHIHDGAKEVHHFEKNGNMKDVEMEAIVMQYHPDLESVMQKEIESFEAHLDEEINNIHNNHVLNHEEKKALRNNYRAMRHYRIQRAKNKIFYFHAVETVCELIRARKIKTMVTHFDEYHWHVLQTIEGVLAKGRSGLKSHLDTFSENNEMKIKLTVEWYL